MVPLLLATRLLLASPFTAFSTHGFASKFLLHVWSHNQLGVLTIMNACRQDTCREGSCRIAGSFSNAGRFDYIMAILSYYYSYSLILLSCYSYFTPQY